MSSGDGVVHVYLLGPIEVVHREWQIPLGGCHKRALLAALASEAGKVVPAGRLIDALWGERPPAQPRTKLQGYVSGLRKELSRPEPATLRWPLVTREPGYLLSTDRVAVDLLDYRALLQRAARELDGGQVAAASDHLGQALGLWRGPAYADARTPVLCAMAAALEAQRLLAIECKSECDLQLGRSDAVAGELGILLSTHPTRERMRAAVMLALYRSGCRAEALESYRIGRVLLREQLGIEPGPVLQRLHELMLRDDPQLVSQGVLNCLTRAIPPAADPA